MYILDFKVIYMDSRANNFIDRQIAAQDNVNAEDVSHLRFVSMHERGLLIESACEAAAVINRSRLAAGLPVTDRNPWPKSTWEFLEKQAAHARS